MSDDNVVHVTPEPDDPPHTLSGFCWCSPVVEDVPPEGRIYIHRRTIDSPHIEEDEEFSVLAAERMQEALSG